MSGANEMMNKTGDTMTDAANPLELDWSNVGAEFATALAKAQAEMGAASRDALNPHFRSKYADLASVWDACRGPLTSNGFSVVQLPNTSASGVGLITVLLHSSGQKMLGRCWLPVSKQDAQGYGSAITYARRYSLAAMAGVVADEDDDGNAASARPNAPPAPRPRGPSASAPAKPKPAEAEYSLQNGKELRGIPLSEIDTDRLQQVVDYAAVWLANNGPDAPGHSSWVADYEGAENELHKRSASPAPAESGIGEELERHEGTKIKYASCDGKYLCDISDKDLAWYRKSAAAKVDKQDPKYHASNEAWLHAVESEVKRRGGR